MFIMFIMFIMFYNFKIIISVNGTQHYWHPKKDSAGALESLSGRAQAKYKKACTFNEGQYYQINQQS
jgi:hypothetical protein